MRVRTIFIFSFICITLLEASKCEGTMKERTDAAKAIFSGNEDVVANSTSDFVSEHSSSPFGLSVDSARFHCNCITDTFAVQLANEYDLVSLNEMKKEPRECLEVVIDRLLYRNDQGVMHCLGIEQ